jgi:hypothetical protein
MWNDSSKQQYIYNLIDIAFFYFNNQIPMNENPTINVHSSNPFPTPIFPAIRPAPQRKQFKLIYSIKILIINLYGFRQAKRYPSWS